MAELSFDGRHFQRDTILQSAERDTKAALRYLRKAIGSNGIPSLIYIDQSGANNAAIKQYNARVVHHTRVNASKKLAV